MNPISRALSAALVSSVLVFSARAENELATDHPVVAKPRESSVTAGYDRNPGDLNSYSLGTSLAVGEKTRILGDLKRDQVAPTATVSGTSAVSASVGAGYDFTRQWNASIHGDYQSLPGSVFARGAELSARYRLGDWRFGLQGKILRYSSDKALKGKKLRDQGIPERSVTADIAWTIHDDWTLHVSGTAYSYGGATPAELSEVLAKRANVSSGLLDAVSGFPSKAGTIGLGYQISEAWDTDLSVTRTSYELAALSTSIALSLNFEASSHWEFGVSATRLKQDGEPNGTIGGIVATYTW